MVHSTNPLFTSTSGQNSSLQPFFHIGLSRYTQIILSTRVCDVKLEVPYCTNWDPKTFKYYETDWEVPYAEFYTVGGGRRGLHPHEVSWTGIVLFKVSSSRLLLYKFSFQGRLTQIPVSWQNFHPGLILYVRNSSNISLSSQPFLRLIVLTYTDHLMIEQMVKNYSSW